MSSVDHRRAGPPLRTRLRSMLGARPTAGHLLIALLCAVLGFATVTQFRVTQDDPLAQLRQDDLVRLLDELDRRNVELVAEQDRLQGELDDLTTSADAAQTAEQAAEELALTQGVLAGTVPAHGPGVSVTVEDPEGSVRGQTLVTILQELRNSGAEVIELNGIRLAAHSYVLGGAGATLTVDGHPVASPYVFCAIGDPQTMQVALDIPGGALSTARGLGADVTVREHANVEIRSVTEPVELDEAEVVE